MKNFRSGEKANGTGTRLLAYKISPAFLKAMESKGETFGRPAHRAKSLSLPKAQEGRQNSPADCFAVGNPRRGFPGACQRAVNRADSLIIVRLSRPGAAVKISYGCPENKKNFRSGNNFDFLRGQTTHIHHTGAHAVGQQTCFSRGLTTRIRRAPARTLIL